MFIEGYLLLIALLMSVSYCSAVLTNNSGGNWWLGYQTFEKFPFLFVWALKLLVTWLVTVVEGGDGGSARLVFFVLVAVVSASSLVACHPV